MLVGLLILCCSAITVEAVTMDETLGFYVPRLQGTWYDLKGKPALIFDGMSVNGCPIVGIYRVAGGRGSASFLLRISEKTGYRDLDMSVDFLDEDPTKFHQMLSCDGVGYRRTPYPQYYESVGGLGLEMSEDDVLARYGKPDEVTTTTKWKPKETTWMYSKLGLKLKFLYGELWSITFYKYGDRRFDRTGFNCSNSLDEYKEAYSLPYTELWGYRSVPHPHHIGHHEYLWFEDYPNSVTLNLYWS